MNTVFREMISGHAPDWALEVGSVRELSVMARPKPPTVAFAMLQFSYSADNYIDSLDYKTDIDSFKKGVRSRNGHFMPVVTHGWNSNPSLSHAARSHFESRTKNFLPNREGRAEMLSTVSGAFAEFASAIDRAKLRFVVTLQNNVPGLGIHEDAGQTHSAGLVLNNRATLVFPPGSCPRTARIQRSETDVDYRAESCALEQAQYMPTRALCVWNEHVPHAIALGQNMTRLGFFAFVDDDNTTPARPPQPTRWMNARDKLGNELRL